MFIIEEFLKNAPLFVRLFFEHIYIVSLSSVVATVVGLFLGLIIAQKPKLAQWVLGIINVLYTIPAIALLGFLISLTGIGNTTAILALMLYGLLPIVRSTYIGMTQIDPKWIEAGRALGSHPKQVLFRIQLPLAFPVIFSAIRTMVTMTIALAGIASFVGAGGFGVAIYRGITTNNTALIFWGSFWIALMALTVDALLGLLEKALLKHRLKKWFKKVKCPIRRKMILGTLLLLIPAFIGFVGLWEQKHRSPIHIASKPTTESILLAEMVSELIEQKTDLKTKISHGIGGGTANIHPALLNGDFDMYPEYTGTAWNIVLKYKEAYRSDQFVLLNQDYQMKYDLSFAVLFGFNNTYGLGIRQDLAKQYGIKTMRDLIPYASQMRFGAEYDFFEREDGFKALTEAYGFKFSQVLDMDNGLKYQALFNKKIDVMTVFTTDGQLSDDRIVLLEDDLHFYPEYKAGMVVRNELLHQHPELYGVLEELKDVLDEKTMAQLNYQIEVENRNPKILAKLFLQEKGLVE